MNFDNRHGKPKAWKDIWGAGQGVGSINDNPSVAEVVARMAAEYQRAKELLATV
jgi:nitronate monooxygenase